MATNFPTGLDALTNPTGSSSLTSPDHAGQHTDANDAIEALQAKVGINGSAVTTSLDYRVTNGISNNLNVSSGDLYVDGATGRVGISNTSPAASLEINTNGMADPTLVINNIGPNASLVVNDEASDSTPFIVDGTGNVGVGTSAPQAKLDVQNSGSNIAMKITNTGTNYSFFVEDSASTDSTPFLIDASGNVGVGRIPVTLLDVNGTARSLDYQIGASTKSMPRGVVAYNTTTTSDPNITTTEKTVLQSGSFTAVTGRIYKVTCYEPQIASPATASAFAVGRVRLNSISGTILNNAIIQNTGLAASVNYTLTTMYMGTLTAGSTNIFYTLTSGSGTFNAQRATTSPAFIVVEDLGTL